MSEPKDPETLTVDVVLPEQLAAVRERFAAAWKEALHGAIPPRIDDFLGDNKEPERATLRRALERIDDYFRCGGTLEYREPQSNQPDPAAATVDWAQPGSGGAGVPAARNHGAPATVDVGAGGTVDYSTDSGRTTDHAPAGADDLMSVPAQAAAKVQDLPNVGGYQILGILGRGAMGVVYKARQRGLQRIVALKMILAGGHASASDVARFQSEAEAVGRLQHPNIVQVYEVGEQDGCPYLSLEFVDGGSLGKKIAGEPQPIQPAAHLIMLLAQGMEAAHQKGIIHRDLKPSNVMLTQPRQTGSSESSKSTISISESLYGIPKIADFGLAKRLDEECGQTRSGSILGTPSYMAPEQAEGRSKEVGPLADVYALGAVLYELLTGRPPFRGEGMMDTLEQVRHREVVPPSQLQPKVPADLETICLKCLQKEQGRRYASAAALAEDLRRFLAGEPIQARPVSALERGWRWCGRNPVVAGLSVVLFASLLAGTIVATTFAIVASNRADQLALEKEQTERQRLDAVDKKKLAEKNEQFAITQRNRADRTKDAANQQREVAEEELKTFIELVQDKFKDTGKMSKEVRELREIILKRGADSLRKIAEIASKNADFFEKEPGLYKRAEAYALFEIAKLLKEGNDWPKALEFYERVTAIFEELAHDESAGDKARGNQAVAYISLGDMRLFRDLDAPRAQHEYLKALALWQAVLEKPRQPAFYKPDEVRKHIANLETKMAGVAKRLGDPAQAKKHYLANLAFYKDPGNVAGTKDALLAGEAMLHFYLADISWRLGEEHEMLDHQNQCLNIRKALVEKNVGKPSFRQALASAYDGCGDGFLHLGKVEQARSYYQQARQLALELHNGDPTYEPYKSMLAQNHYRLGTVALMTGNRRRSAQHFREALQIFQEQHKKDPDHLVVVLGLARCGEHEKAAAMADKLYKLNAKNPEVLYHLACGYALCGAAAGKQHPQFGHYLKLALDTLNRATPEYYKDVMCVNTDPDLAVLHDQPGFGELIARLKKQAEK
jgi:serine/threonine protein kinase